MNELVALAAERRWLVLGAVLVGFLVRLTKSDNAFPINLPPRWRPWLSVALGIVAGAIDLVLVGKSWSDAAFAALVIGLLPIAGHELFVESIAKGTEPKVPKPPVGPAAGSLLASFAVALALQACAVPFEEARLAGRTAAAAPSQAAPSRDDQRCRELDDGRAWYGGAAKTLGAAGGASGLASLPVEDTRTKTVLIVSGGVAAALAVGAVVMEQSKASSWARECSR